ncbi:MAG: carbamoyltransferase HypF [Candidatus Diapherotrites archaeon]|nr:carbamoyltransferase HypF [Candidatus Diapherotrites archaeon]
MKILIKGTVQGVGFRPHVFSLAKKHSVKGFVRNAGPDVEIIASGSVSEKFLDGLVSLAPPLAKITSVEVDKTAFAHSEDFKNFEIVSSCIIDGNNFRLPVDSRVCDKCLADLSEAKNRRFGYFLTACTDCGPRFSIGEKVPFDRGNTSFSDFSFCPDCEKEFSNPGDRRFFAQTISCRECGPKLELEEKHGARTAGFAERGDEIEKIERTAELLKKGKVGLVKGWGGFHFVMDATSPNVKGFRKQTFRGNKPFAVMAKDLKSVEEFAQPTKHEKKLLESKKRPIVLVEKKENKENALSLQNEKLNEYVSPNLHTVGVMLPYSPLHYLLFELIDFPLVYTSANKPGLPTIVSGAEARELFTAVDSPVDFLLSDNLEIKNRCDDSVVRMQGERPLFLRRGRGNVPGMQKLSFKFEKTVFALGARRDCSISVASKGMLFQGPYIGKADFLEVSQQMRLEFEKYVSWFGKPDVIACDLHPQFESTVLAKELSEKLSVPLIPVQHHCAHSFSPVFHENGFSPQDDFVSIVCDGTGLGSDEVLWGGEVFLRKDGGFERAGHLAQKPYFGDASAREPLKTAASMLFENFGEEKTFEVLQRAYGKEESKFILSCLGSEGSATTSTGRVLDAVSALLGVCTKATFEGEPAMRLESSALGGDSCALEKELELEISKKSGKLILETFPLLDVCVGFENKGISGKDLAASIQRALGLGIGKVAREVIESNGIEKVVLSGGVVFNLAFAKAVEEGTGGSAQVLVCRCPGDAGISAGQAVWAAGLRL